MLNFSTEMNCLIPLNQQGLLAINGPDAAKFLQGQVTCDVKEMGNCTSLLGAQCNIKGRMLLCFRALQTQPEQIILRIHAGLMVNGLASLGKYIVFSKATLADISQAYRCIGITGVDASRIVATVLGADISTDGLWQLVGNSIVIRLHENRYECWLAQDDADRIVQQLTEHCQIAEQHIWDLLNIQAGLGDITPDTVETFTPQAINLQLVNGINFRKGCYTGQEIVARLHYRGNLKRHMYRFEFLLAGNHPPKAGSELHNSEGKVVGDVIIAAQKTVTHGELLASVLDTECSELYIPKHPQKLTLLSLPYAIPSSDEAS